jgi:membrane-bound metal-dependent hydrolase YbcI (DUF457 family)
MAWAYVWVTILSGKYGGNPSIPVLLFLSVIPDIDLLFRGFGVEHRTFTHSFLFWLILFMPFFLVFGYKTLPYFIAVASHFTFGDLLMDSTMIFWPFSQSYLGLNIPMYSRPDIIIEATVLVLALGISYFNGDLSQIFSYNTKYVLMLLPLSIVL